MHVFENEFTEAVGLFFGGRHTIRPASKILAQL
jgi:hypothetical protein